MSDILHHECGVAMIRLLKPLDYYHKKYGTPFYALNKLYLLMEKQHNRGQDGAGVANIKFDAEPGTRYISRYRSNDKHAIQDIFSRIYNKFKADVNGDESKLSDTAWMKKHLAFSGEVWMGHLRYGTYGGNGIEACHPFLRQNNWMTRNLVVAGNFNMTNVDELFENLIRIGQHPKEKADTVTVMENIGHYLDEENERLYYSFKEKGFSKQDISPLIAEHLDVESILKQSSKKWDGGYVICGMMGHGDAFVLRDPAGIRPAYMYADNEVVVVASERPAIQTAFNLSFSDITEIKPGHALVMKKNGNISMPCIKEPVERKSCSFERIYFSRGSDAEIYQERKELGRLLCKSILPAVDNDLRNTVFSFIPNTAEVAFYGMMQGMEDYLREVKKKKLKSLGKEISDEKLNEILSIKPRFEKIAIKDAKLRTFITNDDDRSDMVTHVYDISYGTIRKGIDNLVVIDDSIVRGTTLKNSIIRMLDRLGPKKIIIVSSAPQIRYPDCYGIDMAKIGDLCAFKAAIALLEENNMEHIIEETYMHCKQQLELGVNEMKNYVRDLYKPFSPEQLSTKITSMLKPEDCKADVEIIFQKIEDLHTACPHNKGDWYFTGNYPTPGGNKVVSKAFINYMQGINTRAY